MTNSYLARTGRVNATCHLSACRQLRSLQPLVAGGTGGEDGKFKESEGTGMGEGQGARDVSDQIEDEDQLLGAQPAGAEQQRDEPDQVSIPACAGLQASSQARHVAVQHMSTCQSRK